MNRVCTQCKKEKDISEFSMIKSGKSKGYTRRICKCCRNKYNREYRLKNKDYKKKYYGANPWAKHKDYAHSRCVTKNKPYHKRGITYHLNNEIAKRLWFRDEAYNMKRPSLDRIDTEGNYTYNNCRFIELEHNLKRTKAKKIK